MHKLKIYWAVALLTLLMGCQQLGLVQPDTFQQKLAYAYGVHAAVLQTAASAVTTKAMTPADGKHVLSLADESRALLDTANVAAVSGDPTLANNKLLLATSILTQLQQYLRTKGQ